MPFIVEQRRPASPLQMLKNWGEIGGSKVATYEEAKAQLPYWHEYDSYYYLSGWEYRIREVKK